MRFTATPDHPIGPDAPREQGACAFATASRERTHIASSASEGLKRVAAPIGKQFRFVRARMRRASEARARAVTPTIFGILQNNIYFFKKIGPNVSLLPGSGTYVVEIVAIYVAPAPWVQNLS